MITVRDYWWLGILMTFFGIGTDRPQAAWIGLVLTLGAAVVDGIVNGGPAGLPRINRTGADRS